MGEIYIGVAGWAYKDWENIVYPKSLKKTQHPVEYLARYFDLIEINTSFYGHIRPDVGREWCRKAGGVNPKFQFTAKLNKAFTHSPIAVVESTSATTIHFNPEDERMAKEGYDAIASEGKLGALLMQFPISFKNTEENRAHLDKLIHMFRQYPLAVEIRHGSWSDDNILQYFASAGVAFCNIDQPLLGRAIRPSGHVTSSIGYVRLHGRRYDQWFDPKKPSDRYDYLYKPYELEGWQAKIEKIAKKADRVYVAANNHFEGKAPANALELKSMLMRQKVRAPESLIRQYPDLQQFTSSDQPVPDHIIHPTLQGLE
jgi:uncharacterized protein YecE (DUF72 family)